MESAASGAPSNSTGQKDLSSVLAHIEMLQKQLAEKSAELGETKQREETARTQVAQLNDLNAKLSEAKREAMREDFNNKVRGWIQDLDPKQVPEVIKEEFLNGVEKFVDKGNETGAWKVSDTPSHYYTLVYIVTLTPGTAGRMLRLGGPSESGQHHPEADRRLQCA
jgi:seryl-tRNA synthetase